MNMEKQLFDNATQILILERELKRLWQNNHEWYDPEASTTIMYEYDNCRELESKLEKLRYEGREIVKIIGRDEAELIVRAVTHFDNILNNFEF